MTPIRGEHKYPRMIPGKIVAVYAIAGGLWILFSDTLLESLVKDPQLMARIAIVKGWGFVLATSAILFVFIQRYVTRLNVVNETLRESERRFRELMERVHMVAVMLDIRGDITFCNDFLLELTGWTREELLGRNWFDIFIAPAIRDDLLAMFRQGINSGDLPHHNENTIITRAGNECLIVWDNTLLLDVEGVVVGVASLGLDMTKHRNLESQLRHSQKMESIGTLAGGVAHDFNNILTVIMTCTEMLRNKLGDRERALTLIDQVLNSANRAAKLTSSLLAFSRKQQIAPSPFSLNELITQMHSFLERIIGEDVELITTLYDGELTILADRGQIEQVVMNIVSNARDAMPKGGSLTISTGKTHLDGQVLDDGVVASGWHAVLTLADTGIGMASQEQERIFEPFFTTKDVGKGTGLGLSMAYGIIRQHNGWISVKSEVGGGSRFTIYLPLVEKGADLGTVPSANGAHGVETILLVEDDEEVLQANTAMLEECGYHVITSRSGAEALELFQVQGGNIDLAIIDVVMPHMNGKQVQEALTRLNPGLRVLFVSGYTFDVLDRTGLPENSPFVSKPLIPQEFLRIVRKILDGRA